MCNVSILIVIVLQIVSNDGTLPGDPLTNRLLLAVFDNVWQSTREYETRGEDLSESSWIKIV
jgi:hypothetical protein